MSVKEFKRCVKQLNAELNAGRITLAQAIIAKAELEHMVGA